MKSVFSTTEELDLGMNEKMTGTLPMSLYDLTHLRDLWLSDNQFEGSIETNIGNLKKLESFLINSNQFTGSIPSEIGHCEKLGTCGKV